MLFMFALCRHFNAKQKPDMECICAVVRSVEIDASDLHPGGRYRLCIDMDGSGVPVGALGQN